MFGCYSLGLLYNTGEDVPQDLARARRLLQQACDGGEMLGCFGLGLQYEAGDDLARARSLFQQACDGGLAEACRRE